jgi:hypothetical protein
MERDIGDVGGDPRRDLADTHERRIEAALREVGLADLSGERLRGGEEHRRGDPSRVADDGDILQPQVLEVGVAFLDAEAVAPRLELVSGQVLGRLLGAPGRLQLDDHHLVREGGQGGHPGEVRLVEEVPPWLCQVREGRLLLAPGLECQECEERCDGA